MIIYLFLCNAKSSVRLNEKKHDDEGNIIIHK
ncbi:hypothetical protein T06_10205 [Trichinella sp. T6]|nr:hypothetical protein T06_10205 [Trichinella sp. T6]